MAAGRAGGWEFTLHSGNTDSGIFKGLDVTKGGVYWGAGQAAGRAPGLQADLKHRQLSGSAGLEARAPVSRGSGASVGLWRGWCEPGCAEPPSGQELAVRSLPLELFPGAVTCHQSPPDSATDSWP